MNDKRTVPLSYPFVLKTIATIWNKSYKYIYIVSAKTYIMEEQYETYRSD